MSRKSIITGALCLLWITGALLQAAQLAACWVCMILIRRMDTFKDLVVSIIIVTVTASASSGVAAGPGSIGTGPVVTNRITVAFENSRHVR